MKLLFAHDHIFYKYNNKYYSTGGLSKEVLKRYTAIFDEVVIVSRQKEITTYNNKLTLASMEGVKFVNIPNFKEIKNIHQIFTAKKIINREIKNCDVVIARLPSSIGSLSVKFAKKNKKAYLIEMVACPWDALWNHSLKGKIVAPFMYYKTKRNVKKAPYVIYVTNKFLQSRYPTSGKMIGCSDVQLPSLDDEILSKRLNKINNMSNDMRIIIGTTAAINVRYKGQEYVIKAISRLNKEGYNFEYHLAGGGDNNYLKSIADKYDVSDKVKFLGSIPHDKVFDYLDNIDLYIQPSRQEGLPRALVEAMSRGCPSLGSTTGGIPELLNDKFIFNNGKINEICNILKKIDNKTMLEEAKRSFEKAKEYDKNELDKKSNKFYEEFIKI
ncbi:MAG: glycosyltransferase family 4 protein [Clostridium baratii]|uniref:glycosyltransferase family 4 protein n=1 Tax=Clostridium baratii TaxID=1561 RepID=UPI00242FF3E0|nr:glycosyltransferase family 4 protein [Clostridium baratii]MBS6041958.1 glycosyltransferase family 4 protein [Clostridium baratii]